MKTIDFDNLTDDQLDNLVNDFKTINKNIMQTKQDKEWKPCGEGENICNCKTRSECGYLDFKEVKLKARDLEIDALKDALFMRNQLIQNLDKTVSDLNIELNDRDSRISQLEIDSNYNDMLVTECENLKSEIVVLEHQLKDKESQILDFANFLQKKGWIKVAYSDLEIYYEEYKASINNIGDMERASKEYYDTVNKKGK